MNILAKILVLLISFNAYAAISQTDDDTNTNNEYLNCGSDASIDDICQSGSTGCSIYTSFRIDNKDEYHALMTKGWGAVNGWVLYITNTNQVQFAHRTDGLAQYCITAADVVTTDTIYDVVFTWDGTDHTSCGIYVNNTTNLYDNGRDGGNLDTDAADDLLIGERDDGEFGVEGDTFTVALYDDQLSTTEIAYLFNAETRMMPLQDDADLVAYWTLDDHSQVAGSVDGDTYIDFSGNGNSCIGVAEGTNTGPNALAERRLSYP